MDFQKTTLPNGLRVITVPMPSMESATVEVFVRAGTRNERKGVNGLAHFLEHMVFKGTNKYPSARAISSTIDSFGGVINAHTGKEGTAYYIKAWEKYLERAFDVLSEFIKAPLLKEKEIEKEKGVILEEIAMYEDTPMRRAPDIFEELLYKGSDLGMDVLGTREAIKGIKREDFMGFRESLYRPENMVLVISGRFGKEKVLKMAQEAFGGIKENSSYRLSVVSGQSSVNQLSDSGTENLKTDTRKLKTENLNPTGKSELKVVNKKTEQAHIVLGVRGNPLGHPDRYKEAVLSVILGGGMSSRLWTQVRERRGLAYYVRCDINHYMDTGYLAASAGIRLDKVEEAIKVILDEYRKVSSFDSAQDKQVSQAELNKAKEYIKGRLALGLEDTYDVAEFIGEQELFEKKVKTPEEIMKEIDKVTVEGVAQVASRFFQNARLNLAIIGPFEDSSKFERLLKLGD